MEICQTSFAIWAQTGFDALEQDALVVANGTGMCPVKGQLVLKFSFGVTKSTKKPTKFL